jgi:hypothetical protein
MDKEQSPADGRDSECEDAEIFDVERGVRQKHVGTHER